MKKTLWIVAIAVWAVQSASSQQPGSQWPPPLEPIPVEELAGFDWWVAQQDLGSLEDSLTDDQLARRLSRLYRYQAQLLLAQADGNIAEGAMILHSALAEVEALAEQPGIADNVRFRELFRSIVAEHDYYYGRHMEGDYGSVFELRAEIFETLSHLEDPLAPPTTELKVLRAIRTTIPMTENRSVEQVRNRLLERRRDWLIEQMRLADAYFPMIESILEEEGLPDELKYLAVIESGLDPRVRSRSSAVGMWQFMRATGQAYGLESDSWTDNRMDPVKATRAAARHLKDLYAQYDNNWHVAMAGYNCSPTCIMRAVRRNGGKVDYWGMVRHLPAETRTYIPTFIAAAQIMSNPTAFGLPGDVSGPEYAYDVVPVTGMLSIETIASMVGANEIEIRQLNPELLRNYLPPGNRPYELRIPPGTASRFAAAFANLPEEEKRTAAEHTVRRGESLGRIGSRYGVTVRDLMTANSLRKTTIYPGQRLVVPVAGKSGNPASLASAGIRTVNWGMHVNQPIALDFEPKPVMARVSPPVRHASQPARSNSSTAQASQPKTVTHSVRRGDTLSELAEEYGTSISSIKRLNGLRSSRIRRGQTLKIAPGKSRTVVHEVKRGENLSRIAQKYRTTVSRIRSANNLRSSTIHPGQKLTIIMP